MGKKKQQKKPVVITQSKLNAIRKNIADEIFDKYFLLFSMAIMDELHVDMEMLYEIGKRAERYSDSISDHLVGMNWVAEEMRKRGLQIENWK